MSLSCLLFGLALALHAQVVAPVEAPVVQVPVIPAMTAVHPSLMGSLSDPGSPISSNLNFHAEQLAQMEAQGRLSPNTLATYIAPLRSAEPLDRAAAGAFARAATEPGGLSRLADRARATEGSALRRLERKWNEGTEGIASRSPELDALGAAGRMDPESAYIFDGTGAGSTGVEALEFKKSKLMHDGAPINPLGQGGFGIVYPNPAAEGQVIKATAVSLDATLFNFGTNPGDVYKGDIEATRHLAKAGVGPRLLADTSIGRTPVAVKERVYGEGVQQLIWERRYGPEQHAYVMDLIRRMAAARIRVGDMNPGNFIIGRTLVDPTIRAYHIDGGSVGEVKPEETTEGLQASLYHQPAIFKTRMDPGVGFIETTVSLSTLLEEGLRHHGEKTFWQRFAGFWRRALANAYFPAK